MNCFAAADAYDELAFRKQLASFLPALEPLRSVGPLLAIISGYAVSSPFRMMDMTDPAWQDLFHVLPSTAADKDICLSFFGRAVYRSTTIQFEYDRQQILRWLPAVDPTRPVWYDVRGPQKLVYCTNLLTGISHRLSHVGVNATARISICCTAPEVVYAAYTERGIPTIRRIQRGELTAAITSYPKQKDLIIGDIVQFTKTDDDDPVLYVQTTRGPHRVSQDRLIPLLDGPVPMLIDDNDDNDETDTKPKKFPYWSPFMLMLANGMLLTQAYIQTGSAIVVVDPARFGWMQRIANLDMSYHSIAISRSDHNLLYVAANGRSHWLKLVRSAVDGYLPPRLSKLVAAYQDDAAGSFVPKRHLLALRLPSDFWI